jgi:hypothetical protein
MYKEKRVIRPNDEVVRYYCDNGYGLSVACHDGSYGGSDGLYEIALLKGDKLHYDDHEWQDVRGWLTKGRSLGMVKNCIGVLKMDKKLQELRAIFKKDSNYVPLEERVKRLGQKLYPDLYPVDS